MGVLKNGLEFNIPCSIFIIPSGTLSFAACIMFLPKV